MFEGRLPLRNQALLIIGGIGLAASPANAAILFDDFNSQAQQLDWSGGPNFTVASGSVDLVKNGAYGIRCVGATGGCVDLIGTGTPPATSGTLVSIALDLLPGVYDLSFDYSGNQRNAAASAFTASIADLAFNSGLLSSSTPFAHFAQSFTIGAAGTYHLTFAQAAGPGNEGNILDNVLLTAVPEPASWAMMIVGFGLAGGAMRRRRAMTSSPSAPTAH